MEAIATRIYVVREQRVILDEDLARIYGVETKILNKAVKRNPERFPSDFAFQIARQELTNLKFQIGTSSLQHGGRRKPTWAFTEHGAIMAANVLQGPQAIRMSVLVVRAFVRQRQLLASHAELAEKLAELEHKHAGHDDAIYKLFETVRQLLSPPEPPRKPIGFQVRERLAKYTSSRLKPGKPKRLKTIEE